VVDERARVLQKNEKTKAWSSVVANLGTALIAAAFGRLWIVGLDPWSILWGVGGIYLVAVAAYVLNYLEAEA
jgi:transcriptional accessory protein Tex/SPT6